MANELQNQQQVRRFAWVNPAGGAIGPAGITADELKIHQGVKVERPDVMPIAQRGPVEFIQPSTSSETLRLAVPEAANPFATPTGPRHDHMMVRKALTRSGADVARKLVTALKDPVGVVKAYRMVKEHMDCQLVLAGGGATDDPEGMRVLDDVKREAENDPDIFVLFLPPASDIEINALQRASSVVLQKSLRPGEPTSSPVSISTFTLKPSFPRVASAAPRAARLIECCPLLSAVPRP